MDIEVIHGEAINTQLSDRARALETELRTVRDENERLRRQLAGYLALQGAHQQLQADFVDQGRLLAAVAGLLTPELQSAAYLSYLTARLRAGGTDVCH